MSEKGYMERARFLVRHGEDENIGEKTAEGGSLTPTGMEQIRKAAQKILCVLSANFPQIKSVSIFHTPVIRGIESARIMADEIERDLSIKSVQAEDFLSPADGTSVVDKMTDDSVDDFFARCNTSESEGQVFITHGNVLWHIAYSRFNLLKTMYRDMRENLPFTRKNHQNQYEHGDVTDEYGHLFDENGQPLLNKK